MLVIIFVVGIYIFFSSFSLSAFLSFLHHPISSSFNIFHYHFHLVPIFCLPPSSSASLPPSFRPHLSSFSPSLKRPEDLQSLSPDSLPPPNAS